MFPLVGNAQGTGHMLALAHVGLEPLAHMGYGPYRLITNGIGQTCDALTNRFG